MQCWIEFNMVFYRSKSLIKPTMDMYAAAGTAASVCMDSV
jgi:hypothetical protein